MERWFARIRKEWNRRGAVIVQAAASRAEIGPEEVVERLIEADDVLPQAASSATQLPGRQSVVPAVKRPCAGIVRPHPVEEMRPE
jgi:hypothetical protein